MTYKDIQGWFEFEKVYDDAVERTPAGGVLVEVGCWQGRSLAYLSQRAKDANKLLRVVGVDHCFGSQEHQDKMEGIGPNVASRLLDNLKRCDLHNDVTLIIASSVRAAVLFPFKSLDFVFIDASHDKASVLRDLAAWWPLVKVGGVLAGHDYMGSWHEVREAVDEFFGTTGNLSSVHDDCWWVELKE